MENNNFRAKQFMPFDALKGYKEAIREKQRIIVKKKELSDDELEILSRKIKQVKINMIVKVIYFSNNEYIQVTGMVSKINFDNKTITIVKQTISFEDIIDLSSAEFIDFF